MVVAGFDFYCLCECPRLATIVPNDRCLEEDGPQPKMPGLPLPTAHITYDTQRSTACQRCGLCHDRFDEVNEKRAGRVQVPAWLELAEDDRRTKGRWAKPGPWDWTWGGQRKYDWLLWNHADRGG